MEYILKFLLPSLPHTLQGKRHTIFGLSHASFYPETLQKIKPGFGKLQDSASDHGRAESPRRYQPVSVGTTGRAPPRSPAGGMRQECQHVSPECGARRKISALAGRRGKSGGEDPSCPADTEIGTPVHSAPIDAPNHPETRPFRPSENGLPPFPIGFPGVNPGISNVTSGCSGPIRGRAGTGGAPQLQTRQNEASATVNCALRA